MQSGKITPCHSCLLCLEVMPFCGFNTRRAFVSPAISSNLATPNWIQCKSHSVLWERHPLFSGQRGYSGTVAFWIAPGFTSRTGIVGLTFHFLLVMGKRSVPRRVGSPSPPQRALVYWAAIVHLPLQTLDLQRSDCRSDAAIRPLRPTFVITEKWRSAWPLTY